MTVPLAKTIFRIAAFAVSIVVYVFTILAAYGGRINPELFTFPSVLTLILPWLALATFLITIAWFCLKRIVPGVLGTLTILVSWGPIGTASPMGFSKTPDPGAQTFTLMTYNMIHGWDQERGRYAKASRNRTIDYIMETDADIVCMVECINIGPGGDIPNLSPKQFEELKKKYPYRVGDNKLDMKLMSKYPAKFIEGSEYIKDSYDKRRYTFYKVNINGQDLTVVVVHLMSFMLSTKEREVVTEIHSVKTAKESYSELKGGIRKKLSKGFIRRKRDSETLREVIDTIKGPLIICGDFNDVPESYAYRLIRGSDVKDAYVETGFGPLITYNQHAFWFHLDQILYRGDLKALNIRKGKIKLSDHYPLIAEFEFTKPPAKEQQ